MQLTIRDETAGGTVTNELTLDVLDETITVRELIRGRVYQEVDDHNRRVRAAAESATPYHGLVTPTPDERALNGQRAGVRAREVDWKKQYDVACDAFERNGFFVLIDDVQAETLDEPIALRATSTVSFVKLTPLVGGIQTSRIDRMTSPTPIASIRRNNAARTSTSPNRRPIRPSMLPADGNQPARYESE